MKNSAVIKLKDFKDANPVSEFQMIIFGIMGMDADLLNLLLDDQIDYEDTGKLEFVIKLRNKFIEHMAAGDDQLWFVIDHCKDCNCNEPVCKFIGNNSGMEFALYFEFQNEKILDIYHCNYYGE